MWSEIRNQFHYWNSNLQRIFWFIFCFPSIKLNHLMNRDRTIFWIIWFSWIYFFFNFALRLFFCLRRKQEFCLVSIGDYRDKRHQMCFIYWRDSHLKILYIYDNYTIWFQTFYGIFPTKNLYEFYGIHTMKIIYHRYYNSYSLTLLKLYE